jgi:hypothetical protein
LSFCWNNFFSFYLFVRNEISEHIDNSYNGQILELENENLEKKINSLNSLLEKQKLISMSKVNAVESKYQQIKIINELLQVNFINVNLLNYLSIQY